MKVLAFRVSGLKVRGYVRFFEVKLRCHCRTQGAPVLLLLMFKLNILASFTTHPRVIACLAVALLT